MLTKDDLKQIRTLVREEVETEAETTRSHIDSKQLDLRRELKPEIWGVKDQVKNLDIKVTKNHKEVLAKLKVTSDFLDRENLSLVKRVKQIEEELDLQTAGN